MSMFSNDVRVVNTATPAFHTEPNVTQYGWTKSDAAYYNQLIQYVDEARQIYEYISEKVIYFDGVLSKLEGIENVIDFMVQKSNEVAEDAREVRAATAYVTGAQTQIEIMYRNFTADYTIFNSKYADFTVKYEDVLVKAYAAQLSAEKAEASYLATKELYEDLKNGQVYRGTWNPTTNAYPDNGGTNSVWDVVLDRGTASHNFDNKDWRSGDRLIYVEATGDHLQIETGSGVDSINGMTGAVTLTAADLSALKENSVPSVDDCNTITATGFYNIAGTNTNWAFPGIGGYMQVMNHISTSVMQVAYSGANSKVQIRSLNGAVWSEWIRVYSASDKPGPGEIGALAKNGDLVTGIMRFDNTVSDIKISFGEDDSKNISEHDRDLTITNEKPGGKIILDSLLGPVIINNGVEEEIYHKGNLPTVESQGALTKADTEATGNLLMRVGGPRDIAIDVALAGATGGAFVSEDAPAKPFQGARWFDTNDGRTYIWYNDGDSSQWVEENPQSADIISTSTRMQRLANEGILTVADNIKNVITVNNSSSISYQDQSFSVFHNFANGNGLEWSQGVNGENTLMTLNANGSLRTVGVIYSKVGQAVESRNNSLSITMEAPETGAPYIASKSEAEAALSISLRFGQAETSSNKRFSSSTFRVGDNAGLRFSPNAELTGTSWGMGVDPSNGSLGIHRYSGGVWQQSPIEFSANGSIFSNTNFYANGSIVSNGGYLSATRAQNPMVELHSPGVAAAIMYLPAANRLRFGSSNGAGGETQWYTELSDYASFFQRSVRPTMTSCSWGERSNNVGGMMDREDVKNVFAGQWFPAITSSAYVNTSQGYISTWSLGYYRDADAHNGSVILHMGGDGTLSNGQRFRIMSTGGIVMDGTTDGTFWNLQEGGHLYGNIFGNYRHMVNWCTASFAPVSDRNYKEDLGPSTSNATDVIKKFDFRKFRWTKGKHKGETVEIGLIAQDLEKINPNLADDIHIFKKDSVDPDKDIPDTSTEIKTLNTAALLTLALKSIKELEDRIAKLGG